MNMITQEQLQKILNITDTNKLILLTKAINDTAIKYSINTPLRLRHFLAQVMHESINFTATVENLNYSAKALLATWPTHFTPVQAAAYERKPEKIGNRAYANRMGNSDEASGDGFKFRGRSYIQITGRDNYKAIAKSLNIDLINHPELLQEVEYAMLAAGWFWSDRNLNKIADISGDDVKSITKIINGGFNGLDSRQKLYNICKKYIL